ncbi:M48 family metalloprotease, partial [Candidatus Similichlamydia epinepheli]|uniref:M48 family metalloprotease n=1 Tax=Candidatus Similichlamydia epinepheli TaxID=1903953 RepID=UPI001863B654
MAILSYLNYFLGGGTTIAESLNGELIPRDTNHPTHRIVWNLIEELAIAADLPVPKLYILPDQEINAFAAGTSPSNWVIGITKGTIQRLSRDEIQGVLAHEFGHLKNKDLLLQLGVT